MVSRRRSTSPRKPGARLGVERFLDAARRWDTERVTEALRGHPQFAQATDRSKRTALHLCAAALTSRAGKPVSSSIATARALLRAGANINAVQPIVDGDEVFPARPVWHAIARGGNRALARFLLAQGADPNHCLWAVVWNDDLAMARLLAKHHADLDLTFCNETPLLYATRLRRTRMLRWLLRNGASPNIGDAEGRTPLLVAIKRRYSLAEVEELLKAGANPAARARDGSTPLSLMARSRQPALGDLIKQHCRPSDA